MPIPQNMISRKCSAGILKKRHWSQPAFSMRWSWEQKRLWLLAVLCSTLWSMVSGTRPQIWAGSVCSQSAAEGVNKPPGIQCPGRNDAKPWGWLCGAQRGAGTEPEQMSPADSAEGQLIASETGTPGLSVHSKEQAQACRSHELINQPWRSS